MAQQLKRWESPRRQGRNHKGKGGAARMRQLKKQQQQLRKQLKTNQPKDQDQDQHSKSAIQGKENLSFPIFMSRFQFNIRANSTSHAAR
ncbi:MAG: hypothetical protein EA414_05645 [Arthrospira sp. PLM2.Bin9]|nr:MULTISPECIES: hypothetical protein [unclassified Arthrospira]MBS0015326.1 hypothetical protein [Arthrospira sp. SH-MAG29]TVU54627.1 MAG: hypothetical protein EA414_05645 [Arthrospira sp. PLM2.Bin9]